MTTKVNYVKWEQGSFSRPSKIKWVAGFFFQGSVKSNGEQGSFSRTYIDSAQPIQYKPYIGPAQPVQYKPYIGPAQPVQYKPYIGSAQPVQYRPLVQTSSVSSSVTSKTRL